MTTTIEPMSFLAGTATLGYQSEGWNLNAEPPHESDRVYRAWVQFSQPFAGVPLVHLGLAGFDISNSDAARLGVVATHVTNEGFAVQLSTWLDSRIWRVDVNWLAVGK